MAKQIYISDAPDMRVFVLDEANKMIMSLPYGFFSELTATGEFDNFVENASMDAFENELKPWESEIGTLTPEEERVFYSFAYALGCFSTEKEIGKNGEELEVTKGQKRSSMLASMLKSGALTIKDICNNFSNISAKDRVGDNAIKFLTVKNGREYPNVIMLKNLNKENNGLMKEVLVNFDQTQQYRHVVDNETGKIKNVPWDKVFVEYMNDKRLEYVYNFSPIQKVTSEALLDSKKALDDAYFKKFLKQAEDIKKRKNDFAMEIYNDCCARIYDAQTKNRQQHFEKVIVRDKNGEIIIAGEMYINKNLGQAVIIDLQVKPGVDKDYAFKALQRGVANFVEEYDRKNPDRPMQKINISMSNNELSKQCRQLELETRDFIIPSKYIIGKRGEERILYNANEDHEMVLEM